MAKEAPAVRGSIFGYGYVGTLSLTETKVKASLAGEAEVPSEVTPGHYLLDLVYNPPLTQFLDYGRQRGAHILNGETMLREQAEASWRIWNE